MLAALIACGLISPVLASDVTANHDAITLFAAINYNLSRLAPDLNVNCIVDVVASCLSLPSMMPPAKLATIVPLSKLRNAGLEMIRTIPDA
jgi:hypothetical protein